MAGLSVKDDNAPLLAGQQFLGGGSGKDISMAY